MRFVLRSQFLLLILLFAVEFRAQSGLDAVGWAAIQIGKPYIGGARGPNAFDCSGLVEYCYGKVGIALHGRAIDQAEKGIPVPGDNLSELIQRGALQRGDLLFFETDERLPGVISHVGIFQSGTDMIHAANLMRGVVSDPISGNYWKDRFIKARRINQVASIEITPANPTIFVGSTIQLTAVAKDASGNVVSVPAANFHWSAGNLSFGTVNGEGLVTGVAAGLTQITVTESSSGKNASVPLRVLQGVVTLRFKPDGLVDLSGGLEPPELKVELLSDPAADDITLTLQVRNTLQCACPSGQVCDVNGPVIKPVEQTVVILSGEREAVIDVASHRLIGCPYPAITTLKSSTFAILGAVLGDTPVFPFVQGNPLILRWCSAGEIFCRRFDVPP